MRRKRPRNNAFTCKAKHTAQLKVRVAVSQNTPSVRVALCVAVTENVALAPQRNTCRNPCLVPTNDEINTDSQINAVVAYILSQLSDIRALISILHNSMIFQLQALRKTAPRVPKAWGPHCTFRPKITKAYARRDSEQGIVTYAYIYPSPPRYSR